jgi:hypothetical protein
MSFEKRHDEGSSRVARLHVDESVSGYARQMAAAVPAHQYSMYAPGGADLIGVQRAQASAANCWPLREQSKREHGKRDTYELERLPFSCPNCRPDASSPRAPASLAVVRCDAGKTWVERW